jgi:cobalamin biosynthesis Mg chelatase CobN
MTSGHDPDKIDPSKQSGRPVMLTGALVGLLLAIALMVVVFFLAR